MHAVIFEVYSKGKNRDEYLDIAKELKKQLIHVDGFISIERFQSLNDDNKILSLSFWESQEAIKNWKNNFDHLEAQQKGRNKLFLDYRIRIAEVGKDYTKETSNFKINNIQR
jgi:heme-degrading monooxygenase HmoA